MAVLSQVAFMQEQENILKKGSVKSQGIYQRLGGIPLGGPGPLQARTTPLGEPHATAVEEAMPQEEEGQAGKKGI